MKVCIKGTGANDCGCKNWLKGIRTINGQYPDDNRDFDINAGNGIKITPATAGITITNDATPSSFIEGDNIEITPSGDDKVISLVSDPIINGDLQVNGDIIQNGSAYETHAEQVYTTKDYIITRDGAISALSAGDYSGFQVKKYDGTNDGRLVMDNQGVARVGDVGDEQPLLTRDESANMSNGALIAWDGTDQRAETLTGNIGSDTKPIKIVNGQAVAVTNDLLTKVSTIMAFNTTGETIAVNTVSAIQLGNYRGNDTDTFELSNNKVIVKKTGYYYIHFELLGKFGASGRAQVGISYNGDNEYSYALTYVQGMTGTETITGSYLLRITSPNQTIGLTGWCENGSITVSNAKQATKLIIIKVS